MECAMIRAIPVGNALLLLLLFCQEGFCWSQQGASREYGRSLSALQVTPNFIPARYKSITLGKSGQGDVIKAFGKPLGDGLGTDGWRYLRYKDIWLTPGEVQFSVNPKSGIVESMSVYPTNKEIRLVQSLLGSEFVITRWSMLASDDDGDGGIPHRHPQGEYRMMEYPRLGVVVKLDGDRVRSVEYMSLPFGGNEVPSNNRHRK